MVDKPISKQELLDAQKDAKTLEEVVSGPAGQLVKSRLGREYYTLASFPQLSVYSRDESYSRAQVDALNSAIAGGHKGYTTLALAQAIQGTFPANTIIEVTNDPDSTKNGTYQWNGTTLTKSAYDPLTQAIAYSSELVDLLAQEVAKKLLNSTDNSIINIVDIFENIVFKIDKDGKVHLVGMDTDLVSTISNNKILVQQLSNDVSNQVLTKLFSSTTGNIIDLVDASENIVFKIDKDGKVHLVGLDTDLVTAINSKSETGLAVIDTSNLANYCYKDTFEQSAQSLLNFAHSQNVGLYAPAPFGQLKQNFTLSNTWLDQAVISEFPAITPMNTPYGMNRGVVHPNILEFPNGFNGYRYLLGMTGYTNGNTKEENPFIYGSNDLQTFDLLTGLLDEPQSYTWEKGVTYNSDIVMFYDPKTLELCVAWRRYLADTSGGTPNETSETIYCIRTKDLKTWSEKEVIFYYAGAPWGGQIVSPVFLFDVKNDTWHLYAPSGSRALNSIRHFTSKTLKNDWMLQGTITDLPVGSQAWHLDGKFIGDRIALMVQDREPGTSFGMGMRMGVSDVDNYTNFTWASKYLDDVPNRLQCYKGTFVPNFNQLNQMAITYIWTANSNEAEKYKLLVQTTPFFDAGVTVK